LFPESQPLAADDLTLGQQGGKQELKGVVASILDKPPGRFGRDPDFQRPMKNQDGDRQ